jgi:hypothetical protein
VIGVTGHRQIDEYNEQALQDVVSDIFDKLIRDYPHTHLIVLSPLAEGADRLVAKVGLDHGATLIVPLPMKRTDWCARFKHEKSKDEFDDLCRKSMSVFEVRDNCKIDLADNDVRARIAFEISGLGAHAPYASYDWSFAYMALNSDILIALWQGGPIDREGGTAHIVDLKLNGVPKAFGRYLNPLDNVETGPVYHIVTPRDIAGSESKPDRWLCITTRDLTRRVISFLASQAGYGTDQRRADGKCAEKINPRRKRSRIPNALELNELIPTPWPSKQADNANAVFDRIYARIDEFNDDADRLANNKALDVLLIPSKTVIVAERLAQYFRQETIDIQQQLLCLVFFAVLPFNLFTHLQESQFKSLFGNSNHAVLLLANIVLFMLMGWLLYRQHLGNWHRKHLEYRALTQALHVQRCWQEAGLPDSVADEYLRKQRGELDWIREALRSNRVLYDALDCRDRVPEPQQLRLAHERWVKPNLSYYKRKKRDVQRRTHTFMVWTLITFSSGFVLSVCLALRLFLTPSLQSWPPDPYEEWLGTLIATCAVAAALFHNYAEKRAWKVHVKRYDMMERLFERGDDLLYRYLEDEHDRNVEFAKFIIAELGREALTENADWLMLHRDRPIDMPHA